MMFLVFAGHDFEGDGLVGGHEWEEDARALADASIASTAFPFGHDYARVIQVPDGDFSVSDATFVYAVRRADHRYGALEFVVDHEAGLLPVDESLPPAPRGGGRAARHVRTRGAWAS